MEKLESGTGRIAAGIKGIVLIIVMISMILLVPLACYAESLEETAEETEAAVNNTVSSVAPVNLNTSGYDVVFVIDNSRSVWNQQEIRDRALRSISNLAVGADIRIGGVYFADHIYKTLSLTSVENQEGSTKVSGFLNMTEQDEGNIDTNIGAALESAMKLFEDQDASRQRIIILFSDGINENAAQEISYKEAADARTKDAVRMIEEAGIPVYCVYLQKSRNDEAYLKELVNYFSADNSFETERFKKVTQTEIDMLSEQFAEIFYAMQNDMKYRSISLDSTGTAKFYVPSLGVNKLQIYIDSDYDYKAVVNSPEDDRLQSWQDGTATFASVETPSTGEWSLMIESNEPETLRGTIAYYAYLTASAEVIEDTEGDEGLGSQKRLKVHFYDVNGQEITVDPAARVTATAIITDEDGAQITKELAFAISDEGCISDTFTVDTYGSYCFELNISYEDFIDLSFDLKGGEVEKHAPKTFDRNGDFEAAKSDNGYEFSFKAEELYRDVDGDDVTIENVVQINSANPVSVVCQDGYVNITAQNTGDVSFALNLKDSSGMTASVTITGQVIDVEIRRMIKVCITAVLLVIAFILIISILLKQMKNKKLQQEVTDIQQEVVNKKKHLDELYEQVRTQQEKYNDDVVPEIQRNKEDLKLVLYGGEREDGEVEPGILRLTEGMLEDEVEIYGLDEYIQNGYAERVMVDTDAAVKSIDDIIDKADGIAGSNKKVVEAMSNNAADLKKRIAKLEKDCKRMEELNEQFRSAVDMIKAENEKMNVLLNEMISKYMDAIEVRNTKIECDLRVKILGCTGTKVCKVAGRNIRGSYSLDEVSLLGHGTVRERNGGCSTGIMVAGFADQEGQPGLILRSQRVFKIKDQASGGDMKSVREIVLEKGKSYNIECTGEGSDRRDLTQIICMTITVK